MTPDELKVSLERIKIQLMRRPNSIFYTTIIFSMKHVWTDKIDTAAVDGTSLFVNPTFWEGLSDPVRMFVLCHEALHLALNHLTRRGARHPKVWNYAADYVINLSLRDAGYSLWEHCLVTGVYANMNTEQVYDLVYKDAEETGIGVDNINVPGGGDIQEPCDPVENQKVQDKVDGIVQRAAENAKLDGGLPGSLPGEIAVNLEELTNPKLPWELVLQNYMSQFAKTEFSWSRPNKRYLPNIYVPTQYGEAICDIATAVDTSGSVSDEEFSHFIGEHGVIQERLQPDRMTVISFDTHITNVQTVTPDTNIMSELVFHGRGGTDLHDVFGWATENNPEVLVIFTDGEFHFPSENFHPTCPIVWIIHNNPGWTAPIGEVIHYDIN